MRRGLAVLFVADYVYTKPPPATPTPTPSPTPQPVVEDEVVPPMSLAEAKANVPDVLKGKYGKRFARSTLTRACSRLSREKVRCRVAWRKRPFRYRGTVTLWNDPDDPSFYLYNTSVKRTRTAAPKRQGTTPEPAAPSCNPNYSGVCLPLSGDVDCGEISARDFGSVGSDPFRLDGDGDGIACES